MPIQLATHCRSLDLIGFKTRHNAIEHRIHAVAVGLSRYHGFNLIKAFIHVTKKFCETIFGLCAHAHKLLVDIIKFSVYVLEFFADVVELPIYALKLLIDVREVRINVTQLLVERPESLF